MFPEVQDAANQRAFRAHLGVARGSVSHYLSSHVILLCCEIQLPIGGSLDSGCRSLEGIKVGGATDEEHVLELERCCGVIGTRVLSRSQEEEVCKLYHI